LPSSPKSNTLLLFWQTDGGGIQKEMLAVAEIDYIRHQANKKGCSYSEIGKQMNRDPRTVQKYAELEDFNLQEKPKQIRQAKVMEPVKPILDQWIQEDLQKKKKFRRTAQRMYSQLVELYQFEGSSRSVRHYVSQRKQQLGESNETASLPLESKPGTAQVDFGEAPFKYEGEIVTLPFFVLSFPYSNTFYFQVFPSQNRECFLEGLKRIFHYIGGVPKVIRFDNLSPAVKKVLPNGQRELTDEFQNFVFHYDFDYEFCNPGSGNEKGHVEAMVKYVRNNFLLPELSVFDLEQVNETFWEQAEKDRERIHYQKEATLAELYLADKEQFLQLPSKEFQSVRYERVKADKYGYIRVDNKLYSTSPRFAKSNVLAKIAFDTVDVLTEDYEVIVHHSRLYGKKQKSMIWQPYLNLMAKRPTAFKYTSFYEQLPPEWKTYFANCTISEKQDALRLLSVMLKDDDLKIPTQALQLASQHGHPSIESIKQTFYQLINGRGQRESIRPKGLVPEMPNATRGLSHYDQLLDVKGGNR
jgi:transposase